MLLASPSRPETYFELLGRSLNLYWHALGRTILLSLLLSIVVFSPRLICLAVGQNVFLTMSFHDFYQLLYIFTFYFCVLWFLAAAFWRVYCVAQNKKETYISDLKQALKKILYIVGAAIIIFFVLALAAVVALNLHALLRHYQLLNQHNIPASFLTAVILFVQALVPLYMTFIFYFYFPLIVIENDKIFTALKQSVILVWGNMWRTLSLQVTPWVVYLLVIMLLRNFLKLDLHVYFFAINKTPSFFATALNLVLLSFFIVWSISVVLVQLWDLELRKKYSGNQ